MGKFFEEFSVGDIFTTPSRVVTPADITAFATLTGDHNPLHVDEKFARASVHSGIIAHGPMMVGITFGLLSKIDLLDGTIIALKNIEWAFKAPLHPDDGVYVRATVSEARPSSHYPDRGYVTFDLKIFNQIDECIQTGKATGVMKRR